MLHPNASRYAKKTLEALHNNIKVILYPDNFLFYWSHHEKICIIDRKIGYMGGIDQCFGRYEMKNYPIFEPEDNRNYFTGKDWYNPKINILKDTDKYDECVFNKLEQPRMPWRDHQIKLEGQVVNDMVRHFIQFWDFSHNKLGIYKANSQILMNYNSIRS